MGVSKNVKSPYDGRRYHPDIVEKMTELFNKGCNSNEISKEVGVAPNNIVRFMIYHEKTFLEKRFEVWRDKINLSEIDKAYWAAWLEGEGYITLSDTAKVRVSNTDFAIMDKYARDMNTKAKIYKLGVREKLPQKKCDLFGKKAAYILKLLLPYFKGNKIKTVEEILEAYK